MTAKEKAEELVGKYYYLAGSLFEQKECAKILVDEILKFLANAGVREYWEKVNSEIENL